MDAERLELYRKIQPLITWEVPIWQVYIDSSSNVDRFNCTTKIPSVYDPDYPERSLIGMLAREKTILKCKAYLCMYQSQNGEWSVVYRWFEENLQKWTGETLDIALLKAIVWQMEEK